VARVLVDSSLPQLDRLFDYRIPPELVAASAPGVRVRVPIRSAGRIADGFIIEIAEAGDYPGPLSDLDSVVSEAAVLAPEVWALARRVADRAAGSANDVVRLAVPKRQVRVEKTWLAESRPALAPVESAPVAGYDIGVTAGARYALDAVPRVTQLRDGTWVGEWAVTIAALAVQSVAVGASAILAVPDYRDQRQLTAALADVLPSERIVHLDARQSNPERYRAVLECLGEDALAIVGNRSVVYAPAARLGLIAVWDDGDPLHAEPLSPYVHTRDAALVRQEQQGCALVFAGHSRSADVERLVELGWLAEALPVRAVLPHVVPTVQQQSDDRLAAQARIPSSAWRAAREALANGPVLVQVARPGYAPRLACATCGQSARCSYCEGPLATKTSRSVPACQWCGRIAANWTCSNCAGTTYRSVGQGSARTAEDLGRAFPGVRVIIADGEHQVLDVGPAPALVIATRGAEPIAAGGYRAVLLLDGERMLARESLRVAEDCLRWWSNAIALAAPGAPAILVGVGGALASALTTWRLGAYARGELADRRRLRFPPAVRVATVTGDSGSVDGAVRAVSGLEHVDVLGPVDVESGGVRAIVRFDYAQGAAVAAALRAEVIRNATTRRKRVAAAPRPALPTLKVRFDDTEPFDQ
jgi:primosomal protein N' (replication factor Y)